MSSITSYKTTAFKESQKFLVIDPATQSPSLVLGSDLVSYITPMLNYVRADSTRLSAENTDYDVGTLVQTSGATSPGDNFAATYLVVEGGSGDFPMLNGNDLLVIKGDEFLREQLAQNTVGDGSDLVAHTGTSDTVTEALNKRTIYVDTISDLSLITSPSSGQEVLVSGVSFKYDGAQWQALGKVTPECFGAAGDGAADDTTPLTNWWTSSYKRKAARGSYAHNITSSSVTHTYDDSFFADLRGAKFLPQSVSTYQFRVEVPAGQDSGVLAILGGETIGNDLICRPFETFGAGRVDLVLVTQNKASFLKETTQAASVIGLYSQVKANSTQIYDNEYTDISRTTSGTHACIGISVIEVDAICHVYGNTVERVLEIDDEDADGISIFSANRLVSPSEIQPVNVRVFGNRLVDCQGRFVKMQAPGQVYANDFRSETLSLITEFRAVDAQYGGVDAYNNDWRIDGVTAGLNSVMYYYQARGDTGSEDNAGSFKDNKIYTDTAIRYMAYINVTGGDHSLVVDNNEIRSTDGLTKITDFVRLGLPNSAADYDSLDLTVTRNSFVIGASGIVVLTGTAFSEVGTNSKLRLTVDQNRPSGLLAGGKVIQNASGSTPYLGDFLIGDNGVADSAFCRIDALGVDVQALRGGNHFYYGTDGSTGGLLNTPANYDRFMYVNVNTSSEIRLVKNSGDPFVINTGGSASWYEHTAEAVL